MLISHFLKNNVNILSSLARSSFFLLMGYMGFEESHLIQFFINFMTYQFVLLQLVSFLLSFKPPKFYHFFFLYVFEELNCPITLIRIPCMIINSNHQSQYQVLNLLVNLIFLTSPSFFVEPFHPFQDFINFHLMNLMRLSLHFAA